MTNLKFEIYNLKFKKELPPVSQRELYQNNKFKI